MLLIKCDRCGMWTWGRDARWNDSWKRRHDRLCQARKEASDASS